MGRYTANTSHLSDDEDDIISVSEEESPAPPSRILPSQQNEESDSESSLSDMYEDELRDIPARQPIPTRNALVEDHDGRVRFSHEVDGRGSSSPSPPITRDEPIPWPQKLGVDVQRMHVMQASLFRMPEEAAAMKNTNQPKPRAFALGQNRKHSRGPEGDALRADLQKRASFAHNFEPIPYRPTRKYARVESAASAVDGNEGAVVDAGLALGRSFRVGWGPGSILAHLGELCGPFSRPKTANSSVISMTPAPIFSQALADEAEQAAKLLQHHLSNSSIEPDEAGVPYASPSVDLHFSSFMSLYPSNNRSYDAYIFRLGHALFDEIDLRISDSITVDIRNRIASLRRKAAVSSWLEDAVAPSVDAELRKCSSVVSPAAAFTFLTGNQVEKACEAAMNGRNVKLATLISQASGDLEFKADLRDQLRVWREQRIDVHIDENVRKIYGLLAGIVDVLEGSNGTGLEKCPSVSISKGLDWKRRFGLHLWHAEPSEATLSSVFSAYDEFWMESGLSPLPWYTDSLPEKSSPWKLPTVKPPDALFGLLKLFSEPACSLSNILNPLSFGPSPMDYSRPWHLYILLSRCMRIRDLADRGDPGIDTRSEVDDTNIDGHSPSADLLTNSYAFQLEQLGMIQEAIFVLLHIEGSVGREKAVKELLSRSAPKIDIWTARGIVGSLNIPMSWVNEVQAIHAIDNGNVFEAYELYLSARLYNKAHELAVVELAPDAINRKDLELLKSLFERFAGHAVDGWNDGGKVFLDYVHISTRLPELHLLMHDQDAITNVSHTQELDELLGSVPKLVENLPKVLRNHKDPRHTAAVAEMISSLLRQLDALRPFTLSQTQVQPTLEGTAKLRHIHSTAYERFMTTIEVT